MEIKELKKVFIEVLPSNIVVVTFKNGFTIEAEDIKEIKAFNLKATGNEDYVLIVDVKYYTSVSSEARKMMASTKLEKNRKAMAVITYVFSQRIIGNLYIKFNRPNIPTKLFSTKKDALNWISTYTLQSI